MDGGARRPRDPRPVQWRRTRRSQAGRGQVQPEVGERGRRAQAPVQSPQPRRDAPTGGDHLPGRSRATAEGHIIYIAKEYGNMLEFVVKKDDPELNKIWEEDVSKISYYVKNDIRPPLVFDKTDWRYKYSKYFTMLYKNLYEGKK